MRIGLVAVDSTDKFPNLPLMKISAYHKARGDIVEWANLFDYYDKVYVSKIFGNEYSEDDLFCYNCKEIEYGGTGYAIEVVDGKEVFVKQKHHELPSEIEHYYPDYSLYPELTKDMAYGFLTRGCPNNCDFCIVSKKEGLITQKVADLNEFWNGQKEIVLLDANILACKDKKELLQQLIDSKAKVTFSQGLDARFITTEIAEMLNQIKSKVVHFAFDFMKNKDRIVQGLKIYSEICHPNIRNAIVYILTNFNTTLEQDLYRVKVVQDLGYYPYIMVYRRETAPKIIRYLQRWSNNRFIYNSCKDFMKYQPTNKENIEEMFFKKEK